MQVWQPLAGLIARNKRLSKLHLAQLRQPFTSTDMLSLPGFHPNFYHTSHMPLYDPGQYREAPEQLPGIWALHERTGYKTGSL